MDVHKHRARKQEQRRSYNRQYGDKSSQRLKDELKKRFKTAIIGSLSAFEKKFGYLWGEDKDEDDLTSEELEYDKMYNECRTQILDNGNFQLRSALNEVDQYNISWNKYKTEFKVKRPPN